MFNILGHETYAVYDGIEGLAKAREIHPDVVFCDIGLPGMDGYEVAKSIRKDKDFKDITLIAMTGYAGDNDIEQARESGFDRHIAKPVDMAALARILDEIKIE